MDHTLPGPAGDLDIPAPTILGTKSIKRLPQQLFLLHHRLESGGLQGMQAADMEDIK